MDYKIKTAKSFDKEIKRLSKRYVSIAGDYAKLLLDISANPHLGTDLGGGLRKIRMAITSKGKGNTVVVAVEETEINLLYIYDKAERSSISKKEIEELLRLNGLK